MFTDKQGILARRIRLWFIPTGVEGSHGTIGRLFVIPTEVEGSYGTPFQACDQNDTPLFSLIFLSCRAHVL